MINVPERYSKNFSEKDKIEINRINLFYGNYYLLLEKLVEKGHLEENEAIQIINEFENKRNAEIFLTPYINKLNSNISSLFFEGLEKKLGKIF